MSSNALSVVGRSLIGCDGNFMTLHGFALDERSHIEYKIHVTGMWYNGDSKIRPNCLDDSNTVERMYPLWHIGIDASGISNLQPNARGPVKLVMESSRFQIVKTFYIVISDGDCVFRMKKFLRSSLAYRQYENNTLKDFEELELKKRPRINLEIAAKLPGDVNVISCEFS